MYFRGWQSFQPGQIRLGKAAAAAVCDDDASAPAQNDAHGIHTGLTASVASPIIAAANDTVYPPYLPLLQKLVNKPSVGRRAVV